MSNFVHLHNHTHYSLLDAITTTSELVDAAVADGQPAIALTDHGVMFGCYEFYKKCKSSNIKPILGFEAYVASVNRFDRTPTRKLPDGKKTRNYLHLLLLAKDWTGYKNLMKLTSLGHTEGFYYRPRIDKELLEKHHEGIIAASACLGGIISAHIVDGNVEKAKSEAQYYKDLFGDDFYLELQRHNFPEDDLIIEHVPKIAAELGIKMIATNDIHYLKKEHATAHNVLLHIKDSNASNSGTANVDDLRYKTPEFYFKTTDEMQKLFPEFPEALTNTVEIAEKCNVEMPKTLHMPVFPIPETSKATNLDEYLEELTYEGLREKYPEITDDIDKRAKYELGVIKQMGFPGYFLIVWDFIRAAKELGVRVGPGRGSAAGSLVAYALSITNVDPLPYDLLFERFLNPERVSMPDIDIDFADDKRDRVIEYVKEKYGANAVSMIITFGTLSTKAALKDIGRVLGIDHNKINDINKKIPVKGGKPMKLAEAVKLPELKKYLDEDPKLNRLVEFGKILEGKNRNTGTHAAGVVIAPDELTEFIPVYQSSKSKGQSVEVASQFTKDETEEAGLLKMDFLGLKTLGIIEDALIMIKNNTGEYIEIDDIDFEDKETYDMLGNGNTQAIFQFESGGMQEYLRQLKPKNLEELTAMNALYRPGPMENIPTFIDRKFGRKPIEYLHPIMEQSLKNTYGIIVYQEQVMQLVQHIAGFTLGQADILRRAMGKKKKALMDAQKPAFIEGAAKHGISEKLALEIFELIEKFASYGFNKSHSLAYSYLAYQTAWLKAHYPAEFLAANMTAEMNDQNKVVELIDEAKSFGIEVLPPDINKSIATFNAVGKEIYFGLAGLRNVGVPAVEGIIESRNEQEFSSFFDFVARVDKGHVNRRAIEALICAGAFDKLGTGHRAALLASIDSALDYAKAFYQSQNSQMDSLFGDVAEMKLSEPAVAEVEKWTEKERLEHEKEVLNFYVSGHPLKRFLPYINSFSSLNLGDKNSKLIGQQVMICGFIDEVSEKRSKNNKMFAILTFEDFSGKAEAIIWPNTYKKCAHNVDKDKVVIITGKAEVENDKMKVYVDELMPVDEALSTYAKGYKIWVDLNRDDMIMPIETMKSTLCGNQGKGVRIMFNIYDASNGYRNMLLAEDVKIPLNHETVKKLMKLFGQKNVGFILSS